MPAIRSYFIEPIWEQFSALLPEREVDHPLGCHRLAYPTGWSCWAVANGAGVFTDYWVGILPGFLAQMVATPILLAGFVVLGLGLRKGRAVPRWVTLVMVGAAVCTVPVTLLWVNHMPGGPLLLLHATWVVLGYVLFSERDVVAAPTNTRVS